MGVTFEIEASKVGPAASRSRLSLILKALLDYLVVLPSLLLAAPLLIFIAILIKIDSPGPIIYRRKVLGLNGRRFDAYKFRTMAVNGEEILSRHPQLELQLRRQHKLRQDPRVTTIGIFLRKFSLDELPQLLNILKRDMSLVGPRFISPEELPLYGPWGDTLLSVMPGLTGWWQVNGRADTSYEQRIQLDLAYIHHGSIWFDLKILILTIPAVWRAEGAY